MLMNKYCLVKVQNYDQWNDFVESSPQGTIFANSEYLEHVGRKFALFFVLRGEEIKAGLALIVSDDEKAVEIDDLVIYNGILFVDDKKQKHVSATFERFEITEFVIDELDKKYQKIEMALSPHFIDTRPFLWHNYHSQQVSEKFSLQLRYTSYLNIAELRETNDEFNCEIYRNLARLRQRRIREAKSVNSATVHEFDPELFIFFYQQLLLSQNIDISTVKLDRIKNLLIFLLQQTYTAYFSVKNDKKEIIYQTLFCFDSKRAYSLFGAGNVENTERYQGTMAFWEAFKYLAREKKINEIDMEGVNSPKRGWFKLSFGGNLLPYFQVRKNLKSLSI